MSVRGIEGWPVTVAAVVAPPVIAFSCCVLCLTLLPGSEPVRFAIAVHLFVPLWAVLACTVPLARSARRAWTVCAVVAGLALVTTAWSGHR